MIVIFFLPSVNVGSSSSVNGDVRFLPSVKVGRSLAVNVDDCYLFAAFSERW